MQPDAASPPVIVLGAGPVGLAAAILLAQAGREVTVYEGKREIPLSDDNSYPIGVNPRGKRTLRRIDPALLARLIERGEVVEGWHIYAGKRLVAKLPSGTVTATTRAFINEILLDQANATPGVSIVTGHKLKRADLAGRPLHFDHGGEPVTVDAGGAQVIAADGVWSATRRSMVEQLDDFVPEVGDWGVRFRVLFSKPGAPAPGLDPSLHHIFGAKGMYTATLKGSVWCVAVTAIDGSPEEGMLLSSEASAANVAGLQDYVRTKAPQAAPLLTRDDYVGFFDRDAFSVQSSGARA